MRLVRRFTHAETSPFDQFDYTKRSSILRNTDGSVVFQMDNIGPALLDAVRRISDTPASEIPGSLTLSLRETDHENLYRNACGYSQEVGPDRRRRHRSGPACDAGRQYPARQDQADLHAAYGHG